MHWLAGFLVQGVTWLAGYFGLQIAKKTAYTLAASAAFLLVTAAFIVASKALVQGILLPMPSWLAAGISYVIPSNLSVCMGAYVGVRVALWIYRYQMENLKLASYIT